MKINIAYILPSLDVGGSEIKVIDLVTGLNKDLFNPIIITITKPGKLAESALNLGVKVICVNKKSKIDFFVSSRISKVLKEHNVDIVHVFTSTGKLWGRLGGISAKTKYIISTEESLFRNKFTDRLLEKIFIKKTSLIIANSKGSLDSASSATKISKDKYLLIYNGVKLDDYKSAKNLNLLGKANEMIIICVARFDERKRIDLLIDCMPLVISKVNARLVLVGNGNEESKLKSQVNRLRLSDKVDFLGFRNDVANLLKEADLFVLPSDEEGFGNVIVEAMASGVAVIASSVGGIPEVIDDNVNGILFKKGSKEELSNAIIKVLSDNSKRLSLINNAYIKIEKFSNKNMINKHQDAYIKLMKGGN